MAIRHTKGPWIAHDLDHRTEHPTIFAEGGKDCLAHVWHNDLPRKIVVANARLMAASPELLEAAKLIYAGLNERIKAASAAGEKVPVFDGIAHLHDAIVKAEGGLTGLTRG